MGSKGSWTAEENLQALLASRNKKINQIHADKILSQPHFTIFLKNLFKYFKKVENLKKRMWFVYSS
jgi:hypothetical protein